MKRWVVLVVSLLFSSHLPASQVKYRTTQFIDHTNTLDLAEVRHQAFEPVQNNNLDFRYTVATIWLKVELESPVAETLVIVSCYMQLDYLTLHTQRSGIWVRQQKGDLTTRSPQSPPHHCFVFELPPQTSETIFIEASGSGLVKIPFFVQPAQKFWIEAQLEQLGFGFYFAVLASMFLYNLFLFLITRDDAYGYYIVYLASIGLFLAGVSGHARWWLWPQSPHWADPAPIILISFGICAGGQFISRLTNAKSHAPTVAALMPWLVPMACLTSLLYIVAARAMWPALGLMIVTVFSLSVYAVAQGVKSGYRPAKVFILALLLMLPSAITYYLRFLDIVPSNWWTNNALYLTTAMEAMVMSIALAYRIDSLNKTIESQQRHALQAQSIFSRTLIRTIDDERRAIARELHDNLGQGLLALKNMTNRLREVGTNHSQFEQINTLLKTLLSDIRNMARNMHPQQIENLGFASALKNMLTETLTPVGVSFESNIHDISHLLDKDQELQLFRIAQECVSNIVRHANASGAEVSLNVHENQIELTIRDDGVGIKADSATGLGLINIRERATILGGTTSYKQLTTGGTETRTVVPIPIQQETAPSTS